MILMAFLAMTTAPQKSWNQPTQWDLNGKNEGAARPDLQQIGYRVEFDHPVLSPEYN